MNNVQNYLKNLLESSSKYSNLEEDLSLIKSQGLNSYIVGKLLRKRFRKSKVADNTREDIKKKVELSIKEEKPIYLIICFGGYKHFWNQSYPEVDWAEFFNLAFLSEYLAPILANYKPGVVLDYESEDVIIPLIDNYPESAPNSYAGSFRKLIKIYSKSIPSNFKINFIRSQEQIDKELLFKRTKKVAVDKRKLFDKLSSEEKELHLHRTPTSIMWKGRDDWTKFSDKEREEKIIESKMLNEAYYDADYEQREKYFEGDNHIPIVLSWGKTYENSANWLTLGSTFSSIVDFWVGRGILEKHEEKYVPRIVSQNQYKEIKNKLETVKMNLIPLKNFESIEVYIGQLNF